MASKILILLDKPQLLPWDLFEVLEAASSTSKLIIGIVFCHQNATRTIHAIASTIKSSKTIELTVRAVQRFPTHFLRITPLILSVCNKKYVFSKGTT